MTTIANPLYDVVFKYLMNNNRVAKFILSKLLERKIIKLEYNPKDLQLKKEDESYVDDTSENNFGISVFYMDFAATVLDEDGKEEIIIIELQKARFHTDVTRFRNYLGSRYINEDGAFEITLKSGSEIKTARHIQTIYLLGHRLENEEYAKHLALKHTGQMTDAITHEPVKKGEDPFVDALTHDSLFVQLPNIHRDARQEKDPSELERIINLFDQKGGNRNKHRIEIEAKEYPDEYEELIRCLTKAGASPEVAEQMTKEDITLGEMERMNNRSQRLEKELEDKDKEIEELKKRLEQLKQ